MVPADVVLLASLPMTASQKVDRRALPEPGASDGDETPSVLAPRDECERRLAALWEELLGRGPIGVRDGFFDLGGHSLLAVRLMARLRRDFGRDLPLATLFVDGTIERLAALLREGESVHEASPLVAIQSHGSKPPLFCVHPAGGNVLCFAELARSLGRERPVYGLQAAGLVEGASPDRTVVQMASRYVTAIRAVRPQGPYHLAGYSAGGAIAYAMAVQLHAEGQRVASLTLLDAWSPARLADERDASVLVDFLKVDPDDATLRVLERALEKKALPADVGLPALRRLLAVMTANVEAARGYRPRRCALRHVTLIRAGAATNEMDRSLGWSDLVDGDVVVRHVDGDHASMLARPAVAATAALVAEAIANAEPALTHHALEHTE
jgi:thioesterase domain-containing protein